MRIHKREAIVQKASVDLMSLLSDWQRKHDLTYGELFSLLSQEMARSAKYMIRQERHPDEPDKPGGLQ